MASDTPGTRHTPFSFSLCGCHVRVHCADAHALAMLAVNYAPCDDLAAPVTLEYEVSRARQGPGFIIQRRGHPPLPMVEAEEVLVCFEEALSLDLQQVRPDLYFLHAAVLEYAGSACVLVAPSGSGKSTMTWGLLHEGFGYGSDEMGAVDLSRMCVHPYSRALCLKQEPPAAYPLPRGVLHTAHRLYVPLGVLPTRVHREPLSLRTLVFLEYRPHALAPTITPVSTAEAGARLFANALNALAHAGEGLDSAIAIASRTRSWRLISTDLRDTYRLLHATLTQG